MACRTGYKSKEKEGIGEVRIRGKEIIVGEGELSDLRDKRVEAQIRDHHGLSECQTSSRSEGLVKL